MLPRAPQSIDTFVAEWNWSDVDRSSFQRLLRNHGEWSERHSAADSPSASLWTVLIAHRQQLGKIVVPGASTAGEGAALQAREYLASICDGAPASSTPQLARMSWLEFALNPFPDLFGGPPGGVSMKAKDGLLKRRLTDEQIDIAHRYLTRDDHDVIGGMLGLATVRWARQQSRTDATASASRSAIFDLACTTGWLDPKDEARNLAWVRAFYADLFAATGGVPVPGDAYDGALINHPDVDLTDPVLNRSGVPWRTIYYQANYSRLQQVKARWDPRNSSGTRCRSAPRTDSDARVIR